MIRRKWAAEQVLWHYAPPRPVDLGELVQLAAARGLPALRWTGERFESLTPIDPAPGGVIFAPPPGAAHPEHAREGTKR